MTSFHDPRLGLAIAWLLGWPLEDAHQLYHWTLEICERGMEMRPGTDLALPQIHPVFAAYVERRLAERVLGDARKRAQMGQVAALIDDVPSVAEVIAELFAGGPAHAREVATSLERLAGGADTR